MAAAEQKKVIPDLLHPLTVLSVEKTKARLPDRGDVFSAVLFQDRIFLGMTVPIPDGREPVYWDRDYSHCLLLCSSFEFKSWTKLSTSDILFFGLGTYQSQLVRVGGTRYDGKKSEDSNEVLVSYDGITWHDSLPPMPTRRSQPTVIYSEKYLVVAGGSSTSPPDYHFLDTVEALVDGQWCTIEPIPIPCLVNNGCFHDGKFFMTHAPTGAHAYIMAFFCEVETLLAQCVESAAGKELTDGLWDYIDREHDVGLSNSGYDQGQLTVLFSSFGDCLVTAKFHEIGMDDQYLFAHSPLTKSWVPVDSIFLLDDIPHTIPLPTGELLLLESSHRKVRTEVFKVTSRASPYDPDDEFSFCALSRLEAAGIQVLTGLSSVGDRLHQVVMDTNGVREENVVKRWLVGRRKEEYPPTWRSLYKVLKELGLEELSKKVEEFLIESVKSLQELSTSVITSALLERRALDPALLWDRLPPYVPPALKRSIISTYSTLEYHLTPLPGSGDSPGGSPPTKVAKMEGREI